MRVVEGAVAEIDFLVSQTFPLNKEATAWHNAS